MNNDIKLIGCALCGLLAVLSPAAMQAQMGLTPEMCRSMAVSHNAKMVNAKNAVAEAEQTKKEAFTNYFPIVSATGMGFNADKGMAKMQLQPDMAMEMCKNGLMGGVTAVQPLFAGGQIVNGNKLAGLGVDVSKLQLEKSENDVELTAEQYFWQLVALNEKLNTLHVADTMLTRIYRDVNNSVNAGVALKNDLLQVQLEKNDNMSNRVSLEGNIAVARMLLAQYLGLEDSSFVLVSDIRVGEMPESPASLKSDHRSALQLTPEYRLLEKNVEATRLKQKLDVGKNMPTVSVGAGYMYHDLLDCSRSFGVVFATVNVPLSAWWGGSHAIKRRKMEVADAQTELTDKSQLLVIGMQKAWNDLNTAYTQLGIACKSIEQAAENLRLNNSYYRAGTATMTDLLKAQTQYTQSRDRFVETYCNYKILTLQYLQLTGR